MPFYTQYELSSLTVVDGASCALGLLNCNL